MMRESVKRDPSAGSQRSDSSRARRATRASCFERVFVTLIERAARRPQAWRASSKEMR